mmetsp:Transcript_265/g.420  ORF Transcript_265/g.420 Transcript_265/m.420 type:complete len:378 (+) Transcript_265:41-1174(+)
MLFCATIAPIISLLLATHMSMATTMSELSTAKDKEQVIDFLQYKLDSWLPDEDPNDPTQRMSIPTLTQPIYNSVLDVHATVSASDVELILTVNGNWQLALLKLLEEKYFVENESVKNSYLITTSPPISIHQMKSGLVKVGNVMYKDAQPHLMVAPPKELIPMEEANFTDGPRIPIIKTLGSVILKRKGDDRINSFWDLEHLEPGRFASSHPAEGGSFVNYRTSVKNIAESNPKSSATPGDEAKFEAQELVTHLFGEDGVTVGIGLPMHRSVPHMIATGQADAGLFLLHLAVFVMIDNPGVFEAVYLASDKVGSTDDPHVLAQGQVPMDGNQPSTFFAIRTTATVNPDQERARENLLSDLQSEAFTSILARVGLRRPE